MTLIVKRAQAKTFLEDHIGAIADFSKAIEINPSFGEAYCARGMVKILLADQKDSGCSDLSKAKELGFEKAAEFKKEYCN